MKIVRFLSTKASLFLSFDSMLSQILSLMNEPLTTFRSKGLKALTAVLEADANTLGDVLLPPLPVTYLVFRQCTVINVPCR
jgi:hypothetical protein